VRIARPGLRLTLWARDAERLEATAALCRARGAEVIVQRVDIADLEPMLAALAAGDTALPFTAAYLVAGLGDTLPPEAVVEGPAQVIRLGQTNFVASAAMAALLAERMAARGAGQIGVIGTAAASHSLPFAASYAGSKAGLARYTDALRLAARPHGVRVTLISPGFFNAGGPPRPGEIPASQVAERAIAAVEAGVAECVVPRRFLLLRWLDRILPRRLRDHILRGLRLP
jgi:short-subunit dehydrogenase